MFGENYIIGESFQKISTKNRIQLPSFTFAEPNDEIAFICYNDHLRLYGMLEYKKILDRYEKLKNNTIDLKEYEMITEIMEDICLKIKHLGMVDNQRRILIPQKLIEQFSFNTNEQVVLNGLGNSLSIRKKQS